MVGRFFQSISRSNLCDFHAPKSGTSTHAAHCPVYIDRFHLCPKVRHPVYSALDCYSFVALSKVGEPQMN